MAISRIQLTSQINTGFADTGQVDFTSVTAGSLLVMWVATNGAGVPTSGGFSDDTGDVWSQGGAVSGDSGETSIWYLENATAGTHHVTINPSGGGDLISAIGREIGGIATSSSLEGTPLTRTQTGTSSAATQSYTTTNANAYIAAICGAQSGFTSVTFAEGGGFTLVGEWESGVGSGASFSGTDRIVSATGSYQATWTLGSSSNPTTVILAFKAAAGGTTFTKNVDGSITASGIVVKQTVRALTGSTTGAGALTKQTQRKLTGSTTGSGTLVKRTGKALAGSITAAGAIVKKVTRSLSGSATPTGTVLKQTNRSLAGSTTGAGTVATVKTKLVALAGSITASSTLIRKTLRALAGSVTPAGTVTKQTNRALAGSTTASGTLTTLKAVLKAVAGSITATGNVARQVGRSLAGTVTAAGTIVRTTTRALSGSVTPAGTVTKQTYRSLGGTLAPAGNLIKRIGKALAGLILPSGNVTAHLAGSGGDTGPGVFPRHTFRAQARTRAFLAEGRRTFKA